jgi:hypothetical protein
VGVRRVRYVVTRGMIVRMWMGSVRWSIDRQRSCRCREETEIVRGRRSSHLDRGGVKSASLRYVRMRNRVEDRVDEWERGADSRLWVGDAGGR